MPQYANLLSNDSDSDATHESAKDTFAERARDADGELQEQDLTGVHDAPVLAEPNAEPYRRRITNPSRGLAKLLKRIKNHFWPPPTPDEIARMDQEKRAKLLEATLVAEAKVATRRISKSLHELGFSFVRRDADGAIKSARYIEFDHVESTEDAHWLKVDMDRWPYGCNSANLLKQEVIDHVSRSVGHKVNIRSTPEAGIWFVIERASGMMGIPGHVPIADMLQLMPQTATSLTVPLGMTNNRKTIYDNIDDMVHVLVAGQTGGGKSTLVNGWITTLITRNTPDQLRLVLLDMKAGLEFQYFEDLPHLLIMDEVETDHGIITDADQVAPAIKYLVDKEAKRRLSLIRASGHRDIKSYNVRRKNPMPRIICVIDEWAQARMGEGGKAAETELIKGLQLLRAVGIHFIICTQVPNKDVLAVGARGNLPTRVAFSCTEISVSTLICGDGSAVSLQPAGRCIYKRITGSQPVQVAWISEANVKEIVEKVKKGESTATIMTTHRHDVTLIEMLEWALVENAGSLRYEQVYGRFAHRGITQQEVQTTLKQIEKTTQEIHGNLYTVEPGAGRRPRRLVAAKNEPAPDESAAPVPLLPAPPEPTPTAP